MCGWKIPDTSFTGLGHWTGPCRPEWLVLLLIANAAGNLCSGTLSPNDTDFLENLHTQNALDSPFCNATGVQCSLSPDNCTLQLLSVALAATFFSGTIPASLSTLPFLQEFSSDRNQISGSIPDLPTSLQVFSFNQNRLVGEIPIPVSNSSGSLRIFEAQNNQLTGTLPSFSYMPLLEKIKLSANTGMAGTLPSFSFCPNLQEFHAQTTKFSGSLPSFSNNGRHVFFFSVFTLKVRLYA